MFSFYHNDATLLSVHVTVILMGVILEVKVHLQHLLVGTSFTNCISFSVYPLIGDRVTSYHV